MTTRLSPAFRSNSLGIAARRIFRLRPARALNRAGAQTRSLGNSRFLAFAICVFALRVHAQTTDAYLASASAKIEEGDKFGAIEDLDRAIAQDPRLAIAYFQRAKAKLNAIDESDILLGGAPPPKIDNRTLYEGAIADFGQAIALNPDFAEAYKARGDAKRQNLQGRGPADRAGIIADYSHAIEAKPDYAEAFYQRSRQRGDKPGSRADLDRAIALKPDYVEALESRAYDNFPNGDLSAAIADVDRALVVAPNSEHLYSFRAAIKIQREDVAGAISDYSRAIELRPTNGYFYSARGLARHEQGDLIGAVRDYATYKELTGDHAGTRPPAVTTGPSGGLTQIKRSANVTHLYLYFALCRLNEGAAVMELKILVSEWEEGWIKTAGLYLTGGLSEAQFLAKAREGAPAAVARQQCQAFYDVGMRRLIVNRPEEARRFFEQCVATGQNRVTEHRFARAELARLAPRE